MKADQRKFSLPHFHAYQIDRSRLIDLVTGSARIPLTFLQAPAGYGKSTLLRQTASRLTNDGTKVVWVNCDSRDRDPEILIAGLHQALISCDPFFNGCNSSLGSISECLEHYNRPIVIILDDYEALNGSMSDEAIGWLASILPDNSRILIGTRAVDEAIFAKLVLAGAAKIINAGALAFNSIETAALLKPYCSADTIDHIIDVAEGWPVIIQLARIKAEQEQGDTTLLRSILRPHSEVFGYLAREVFTALLPEQSDLLAKCAIVDRIDAGIATVLTGNDKAPAILADLTALEPLVTMQTTATLVVKLHPALREFLHSSLVYSGLSAVARLHALAARHYSSTGDTYHAIQHAMAADDPALAADILEEIGGPLTIIDQGPANAWSYLGAIPRPMIEQRPALMVTRLVKSLVDGDGLLAHQLKPYFDLKREDEFNLSPLTIEELMAYSKYVICLFEGCREPVNQILDQTGETVEILMRRRAKEDPRALGLYLPMRFFLEYLYGSIQSATGILAEYETICNAEHYAIKLPSISPHFGMIAYAEGNFEQATCFFSMNLTHNWDRFVGREEMLIKVGNSLLSKIFYDQDRIEDAIANITAIGDIHEASFMEMLEARDITLAYCYMQRQGIDRALEHLDRAARQRELYGLKNLVPAINAAKVVLMVQAGRPDEAAATFDAAELTDVWTREQTSHHWNWIFVEAFLRARVTLLIARSEGAAAIAAVEPVKARAAAMGRRLIVGLCNIYLAAACAENGETEKALPYLRKALAFHAGCDAVRPYLDLSGRILPLVQTLHDSETDDKILQHARKIIDLWKGHLDSSTLKTFLTPRESDVLVELAKGFPTKIIARNLAISPETVKHHLKSIFTKLGVENRKDAVSEIYRRTLVS